MARGVQLQGRKPRTALYHHSLIKILLVAELKKRKKSWEDFLIEEFPGQEGQTKGWKRAVGRSLKLDDATPLSKFESTSIHSPTPISELPEISNDYLKDGKKWVHVEALVGSQRKRKRDQARPN